MRDDPFEWTEADVNATPPDDPYFARSVIDLCNRLAADVGAARGYAAVSGIEAGVFTAIHTFGDISPVSIESDIQHHERSFRSLDELPDIAVTSDQGLVPLIGHEELYGFIRFFDIDRQPSSQHLGQWRTRVETLADHNYTRRVQFLSEPFSLHRNGKGEFDEEGVARQITRFTALSFGADGAVLRRYNPATEELFVTDFEGNVPDALLADRLPGEMLSGAALASRDYGWSVVELDGAVKVRGCAISPAAIQRLKDVGVRAAITCRLNNPLRPNDPPFGTLAYFFRRHNRFSWRDVTLFLGFCKRAADAMALAHEANELRIRNGLLEHQSSAFTQAEVATLLVHDIAHKVFHVGEHASTVVEVVKRQLRNYRSQLPPEIASANDTLQEAVASLQKEVADLRVVGRYADDESDSFGVTEFRLAELVTELFSSMSFPLRRYSITTRMEIPQHLTVVGAKRVLYHVLLNLLLNSIDAIRSRGRSASVHVSASDSGNDYIRLRFWDTGPGFNLKELSGPSDAFKIGVTTKKTGTGLGLPMARNLLARYFSGSINAVDREKAIFQIDIKKDNFGNE